MKKNAWFRSGKTKAAILGGLLLAALLLPLSGCGGRDPAPAETKAPYALTERQRGILAEAGLPTSYEDLSLLQKSAISGIEDMLCYLEQRYDDRFTYVGYVADSPVEQEHLIAASERYPLCGPVTVYRGWENGSFTYRDNYSTLQAKLLYEQALNDWIARYIPESEFIVFSEVSYADETPEAERILAQASAASYILIREDACTEAELKTLAEDFGPWIQAQAEGAQPSVTQFYLTPEPLMAIASSETYEELLPRLRDGVRYCCALSADGVLRTTGPDGETPAGE